MFVRVKYSDTGYCSIFQLLPSPTKRSLQVDIYTMSSTLLKNLIKGRTPSPLPGCSLHAPPPTVPVPHLSHTPSNSAKSSPAHQSNDSTHDDDVVGTRSSRLHSSPVMTSRPKAHSHSLTGRSKGGQGDGSPAKKGSSLGRIKCDLR